MRPLPASCSPFSSAVAPVRCPCRSPLARACQAASVTRRPPEHFDPCPLVGLSLRAAPAVVGISCAHVGQLAQRLSSSVSAARRAGGAPEVLGGARSRGWDQVGRTTLPDRVSRPRRSVCSISAHKVGVRCSSSVCAAALVAADRGSSRGMTTRTRRRSIERRDRSPLSVCGAGDPRSGLCSHRHPRA